MSRARSTSGWQRRGPVLATNLLAPAVLAVAVLALSSACSSGGTEVSQAATSPSSARAGGGAATGTRAAAPIAASQADAVFAGGCFWCVESAFEGLDGVVSVVSGYTGGSEEHPTYADVSGHRTGHLEAVHIVFDPRRITYAQLLEVFFRNIDPTQSDGQFCDRGDQYRSAIFVSDDREREAAQAAKATAARTLGRTVVTEILDRGVFWEAEAYHQDFYRTNPEHYQRYRRGCGRDARLEALWGASTGH